MGFGFYVSSSLMSEESKEQPQVPEFIVNARSALVEGDKLAQEEKPDLEKVMGKYDEAVAILTQHGGMNIPEGLFLMAGAQMNRGNIFSAINSQEMTNRAIAAYRSAIDCFRALPPSKDQRFFLDLSAVWANLAQVLIRTQTLDGLAEATECFDKSIETMEKLPWKENDQIRVHLIGLWLNKGNAHQLLKAKESRNTALDAYEKAVEFAQPLPLDDPMVGSMVSTIWLNRGNTLRANGDEESLVSAVESYDETIRILQKLDTKENRQLAVSCANAMASKAMILAGYQDKPDRLAEAEKVASEAIEVLVDDEKKHPMAAEVALNARQAFCQAVCTQLSANKDDDPEKHYSNATDTVDDTLELIRFWEDKKVPNFRNIARRMFRLGTQLYAAQQPHFLAEFILENIASEAVAETFGKDPEMLALGVSALRHAIQVLEQQMESYQGAQKEEALRLLEELKESLVKIEPTKLPEQEESPQSE